MWLRGISLRLRMTLLVVMVSVALAALGLVSVASMRANIFEERERTVADVVELAASLVQGYYDEHQRGLHTEEEAQRLALENLRFLRYEGDNYVWVNDMDATMLMHPTNTELENVNVSAMEDPSGARPFPLFVETVKRQGAGFVEYVWEYPEDGSTGNKISYVQGFKPWGWIIGTGVWARDLNQTVSKAATTILLSATVFLFFIGIIAYFLVHSIGDPIRRMATTGKAIVDNGKVNLNQRFLDSGNDEVTALSKAINLVFAEIEQIFQRVSVSQSFVNSTTNTVSDAVQKTNKALGEQRCQGEILSSATREMTNAVAEVSNNTETAVKLAADASKEATEGSTVIRNTVKEIQELYDTMQTTRESMEALAQDVVSIDSVLDVINGIAEQTNLLALNAAIEAARAGEQGRGFAVVADEVRSLAQRTQQSTQEIQQIIERLQSGTSEAVNCMTTSAKKAEVAADYSVSAGDAFERIHGSIADISTNTGKIAQAASIQAGSAKRIDESVAAIEEAMVPVRASMKETAESSEKLTTAVDDVQEAMKKVVVN